MHAYWYCYKHWFKFNSQYETVGVGNLADYSTLVESKNLDSCSMGGQLVS